MEWRWHSNATKQLCWFFTKKIIALINSPTFLSRLIHYPRLTPLCYGNQTEKNMFQWKPKAYPIWNLERSDNHPVWWKRSINISMYTWSDSFSEKKLSNFVLFFRIPHFFRIWKQHVFVFERDLFFVFENDTFFAFVNSTYFVFENCKVFSFLKWRYLVFENETFLYLKVPHFLIWNERIFVFEKDAFFIFENDTFLFFENAGYLYLKWTLFRICYRHIFRIWKRHISFFKAAHFGFDNKKAAWQNNMGNVNIRNVNIWNVKFRGQR